MKQITLNQMEMVEAGGKNRDCTIVGGLTVAATLVGGAIGLIGGLMTAASMGCFS